MKRESIRGLLRNYNEVMFTDKAILRCRQRGIDKESVTGHLLNPKSLIHCKEEESQQSGEHKYMLWFRLSHARTLAVRVTINEKIKVITAYIIINKIQRGMWSRWKM